MDFSVVSGVVYDFVPVGIQPDSQNRRSATLSSGKGGLNGRQLHSYDRDIDCMGWTVCVPGSSGSAS